MVYHSLHYCSVLGPAMHPLYKITYIAVLYNIDIQAQWIPIYENTLVHLLSRHDFTKLANQFSLHA